ncbi:MAG TPA: TonB-dependent receptor [Candidatus Competibacteraceae bacterium]|nr:TonB-dependent receptor [Candidatus Competibacteraceae bacterium]
MDAMKGQRAQRYFRTGLGIAWAGLMFTAGLADAATPDLTQFSIEDLMKVKVISAAKIEQSLQDTAAAVFVITADDIRRSGATSVPEALRLAPGVEAARIDASRWSVTIRGFNGRFANKLLVLVDGRSVYTPLFSGVHWEVQGPPLDDIARIEVIRGPGGTLWGANAVNGVINIITKRPEETQGGLVSLTAGDEERAIAGLRYGGTLGDRARYRLYGQFADRDGLVTPDGRDAGDNWRIGKGGFRLDWASSDRDAFTVQGELYQAKFKQNFATFSLTPPYGNHLLSSVDADGGSLQAHWERRYSATSKMALQLYYQYEDRKDPLYAADLETFDLDFQHSFALGGRQEIVWGLGYRRNRDQFTGTAVSSVDPRSLTTELFSAFAQDQIELIPGRLRLIGGVKLEHNDFSGWEWQPSARALWTPHPDHRVWLAASRAVRTLSRGEQDASRINLFTLPPSPFTGPLPTVVALTGAGQSLEPEELTAYELGYRVQLTEQLSMDATLFQHNYDQLLVGGILAPSLQTEVSPPYVLVPVSLSNGGSGAKSGFELAVDWRPSERWRLRLAYSYLDSDLSDKRADAPIYTDGNHQLISLFSSWSPRDDVDIDLWWRYVGGNETNRVSFTGANKIEPYSSVDLRLAWRPRRDVELSLVGTNLLDDHHLEFVQEAFAFPVEVERSLYGQMKWTF